MRHMSLLALFLVAGAGFASAQNSSANSNLLQFTPPAPTLRHTANQLLFDRGIYVGRPEGRLYLRNGPAGPLFSANQCFNIMSYNFSPGESPKLQNVTTCTPGNTVTTRAIRRIPATPSDGVLTVSDQK